MWSDFDWSLLHVSSRKILEALTSAKMKPIEIVNRKPVFDKPVDWLKVEQIVERLISGGVEPASVESNLVTSVEENADVQAPPAPKPEEKPKAKRKGRKRGRPRKDPSV